MALPKRRHSKSRKNKRRSTKRLDEPGLAECSNCGEMKLPHRVCLNCGYYNGKEVLTVTER
ncbi:MAG: 50S ribosomal protein L32 [Candidatus Hydrogenedentes bacterium]|nr:50S ribosomal protein L32 [Candidatus Hydrogenedentota bacterium]